MAANAPVVRDLRLDARFFAVQEASIQSIPRYQQRTAMATKSAKSSSGHLALNEEALKKAKTSLDDGAVTPHNDGPWVQDIIKLLNDSLATELVCVLRYKRHHYMADGLASPAIAEEFLVHAQEEQAHADRIATRIVQLGGEPDFNPATLIERSHADYNASNDLKEMIRANLIAERVAIEAYSQMVDLVGDKDPTTRRLLEEILNDEQEHAEELKTWLAL